MKIFNLWIALLLLGPSSGSLQAAQDLKPHSNKAATPPPSPIEGSVSNTREHTNNESSAVQIIPWRSQQPSNTGIVSLHSPRNNEPTEHQITSVVQLSATNLVDHKQTPLRYSRYLEMIEGFALSGAIASSGYLTLQRLSRPQTRFFPGADAAGIGILQALGTAGSGGLTLVLGTLAIYKINRIFHASCRYTLEKQNNDFATRLESFTDRVNTDQNNIKKVADRVDKSDSNTQELAIQTRNALNQHDQQIHSACTAIVANNTLLATLIPILTPMVKAQTTQAPESADQIQLVIEQARNLATTTQQLQATALLPMPTITVAPTDAPLALPIPTTLPVPKKVKTSCCCFGFDE